MTPAEYEFVVRAFAQVGDLPEPDRAGALDEACREQPHLRRHVQAMLEQEASGEIRLDPPEFVAGLRDAFLPTLDSDGSAAAAETSHGAHEDFAGYELLEQIGRGGMGVVFRARQRQPDRIVAVKMIRAGRFASPADVQRFHAEAQAAARLDHDGIVPIYEVGQHEGEHFFSMKLVDGPSLAERLRARDLPPRQAVELLHAVCLAIGHAHEQGIIHRDLKPSNILLDRAGRPRVTDFGLAKQLHHDSSLTAAGDVMGTPGYMSPEQAMGAASRVTAASDVYSLGAILYEMLTGRPPIQAEAANVLETLQKIQEAEIVAPRVLNRHVPRDLDTICLKCLEKDPGRRYADAGELAEDLRRYLDGEPILARPWSQSRRVWRWARQQPGLAATWAAVAVFYFYHSVCYWILQLPEQTVQFNLAATALCAAWCLGAWIFQRRLRRSGRPVVLFLWATWDVLLLTIFLFTTDSAKSSLALLYHVLVAFSVLRFRADLVGYVTVLSLLGYLAHVAYTVAYLPELELNFREVFPFALSLTVIGLIQYLALRRVRAVYETAGASSL
ncbi:MAG: serine/threonine protein kinase [Candidatus Anammoximicrobium sp.]|mgnify:CR=1 FL=1|nr:serine/threonine protein kinase [Candidatus Anammoximicrobium sp.]